MYKIVTFGKSELLAIERWFKKNNPNVCYYFGIDINITNFAYCCKKVANAFLGKNKTIKNKELWDKFGIIFIEFNV